MSLLALIALALGPAPSVASPVVPAPVLVQDLHQRAYDDFVDRFRQFLKLNDADQMSRMVRKNPSVAVRYADWLTQQVVVAGSEETEKEVNALRLAWKTAMKTNFVENLYEYHSLIKPRNRAINQHPRFPSRALDAQQGYECRFAGGRVLADFFPEMRFITLDVK